MVQKKASSVPKRQIDFRHSTQFVPILEHLHCSLLVSTYAAGKLACISASDGQLHLQFSNFQQAMGVTSPVMPDGLPAERIAVGGPNLIWFLSDAGPLAQQVEPSGTYDQAFLARESFVTGNISIHEMAWGSEGELWVINTLFSCLCTLHEDFAFVPQWKPDFITDLEPQDRSHLNGMAMSQGRPKYVSMLGTGNQPRSWKEHKANGGVIMDVERQQVIAEGLCMPHSPRLYQNKLYALDSGRGRLITIDPTSGQVTTIANYPGYGRGLAFAGQFAIIGMSRARETSVFGGVPICEKPDEMRCGVVLVDLKSGQCVAYLEFTSGVEELFDVQVVPGSRRTVVCGPYPKEDGQSSVWVVPRHDQVDALSKSPARRGVSRRPRRSERD